MSYVLDNSSLIVLFNHFYPDRFPTLWEKFDKLMLDNKILLVREIYNEISRYHSKENRLVQWAKDNRELFLQPSDEEMEFIRQIFSVNHFQSLVERKKILTGPFQNLINPIQEILRIHLAGQLFSHLGMNGVKVL